MNKNTTKIFNLPAGLSVGKIETINGMLIISCRDRKKYCPCPYCGRPTKKVNSYRQRLIRHGKINQQTIMLRLRIRQLICRRGHRQKTFVEKIAGIDQQRSTANYRLLALGWLQRNSFNFIGEQFAMSPSTLVKMTNESYENWQIDWHKPPNGRTKIGIDEHSFRGRDLAITITDLGHHEILDILRNDRQATLKQWLQNIPAVAKDRIREVCIDLKVGYRNIVRTNLPQAAIVVDRFHVEQLANRVLDNIRSVVVTSEPRRLNIKEALLKGREKLTEQERKKLEIAFLKYQKFPILYQAWFIKEKIREMYRTSNRVQAEEQFNNILTLLEDADFSHYFGPFRKTLLEWQEYILNYFTNRTTNAFTEGVHTKIKMMKRVSFGFRNINNYIAKMMLAFLPLGWLLIHHTI